MALCPKCEKQLPANGNCLYCGKLDAIDSYKKPGRGLGPYVGYVVKFGLAAGLVGFAGWLLFTKDGQTFREKVQATLGIGQGGKDDSSEWVKALKKYPRVKELVENRLNYQIEEEVIDGDWRRVAIQRKGGTEFIQYVFRVSRESGEVIGENFEAQGLLD